MYYVTFRSVTTAQRAQRALETAGIRAFLQRTPQALAAGGCGYSIRLGPEALVRAGAVLRRERLSYSKAFRYAQGTPPEEVAL